MKVLVMSKDKRAQLCERWCVSKVADDFCAAMTEVEIPDGCVLAVVDNVLPKYFPPAEVTWDEGYRRVVQEVM